MKLGDGRRQTGSTMKSPTPTFSWVGFSEIAAQTVDFSAEKSRKRYAPPPRTAKTERTSSHSSRDAAQHDELAVHGRGDSHHFAKAKLRRVAEPLITLTRKRPSRIAGSRFDRLRDRAVVVKLLRRAGARSRGARRLSAHSQVRFFSAGRCRADGGWSSSSTEAGIAAAAEPAQT